MLVWQTLCQIQMICLRSIDSESINQSERDGAIDWLHKTHIFLVQTEISSFFIVARDAGRERVSHRLLARTQAFRAQTESECVTANANHLLSRRSPTENHLKWFANEASERRNQERGKVLRRLSAAKPLAGGEDEGKTGEKKVDHEKEQQKKSSEVVKYLNEVQKRERILPHQIDHSDARSRAGALRSRKNLIKRNSLSTERPIGAAFLSSRSAKRKMSSNNVI